MKRIRINSFKIFIPPWWKDISNINPDGLPPTFIDGRLDEPGVLQFSTAEYVSGKKQNPSYQDLIEMSEKIGVNNAWGEIVSRASGICAIGKYGAVEFSGHQFPFISVWHLSNGSDFVFATFICSKNPEPSEVQDVKKILLTMKKRNLFS